MANGAPVHLNLKITRAKLEALVEELVRKPLNLAVWRLKMPASKYLISMTSFWLVV
jgi:hypothetical protein